MADFATDTNTIFIYRHCMYIVFILHCQTVPNNYQIIVALIAFNCVHCEIRANIATDFLVALQKYEYGTTKAISCSMPKYYHTTAQIEQVHAIMFLIVISTHYSDKLYLFFSEYISGTYGINCESQCNKCVHRICDRQDGSCTYDCIEGFKGDDCHLKAAVSGKPFTPVCD